MSWLADGEQEVPPGVDWLRPREQVGLASFVCTKRRVEFLTRRWTAKRAVALVLGRGPSTVALAGIEIRHHASGAPWVVVDGQPAAIDVSISDRAGSAVCLVGPRVDRAARWASTWNASSRAATPSSATASPTLKQPACAACLPARPATKSPT